MAAPVAVEVKIADHERFQALIRGLAGALALFAKLGDEEQAALPQAAREGIEALAGACERMDARSPGPEAGAAVTYQGHIGIEWPAPRTSLIMPGWDCSVWDALNGKPITTVSRLVLRADASNLVAADVTMFADEDGQPVYTGKPHERDGETIWGTFPFLVAEMRVRPAEPPRTALEPAFLAPEPCAG